MQDPCRGRGLRGRARRKGGGSAGGRDGGGRGDGIILLDASPAAAAASIVAGLCTAAGGVEAVVEAAARGITSVSRGISERVNLKLGPKFIPRTPAFHDARVAHPVNHKALLLQITNQRRQSAQSLQFQKPCSKFLWLTGSPTVTPN